MAKWYCSGSQLEQRSEITWWSDCPKLVLLLLSLQDAPVGRPNGYAPRQLPGPTGVARYKLKKREGRSGGDAKIRPAAAVILVGWAWAFTRCGREGGTGAGPQYIFPTR